MPQLAPPPEFLPDGSPPPLESDPVLSARGFTSSDGRPEAIRVIARDSSDEPEFAEARAWVWQNMRSKLPFVAPEAEHIFRARLRAAGIDDRKYMAEVEKGRNSRKNGQLRRISYTSHWRRQDPTSQLAPGMSFEKTVRVETGLTRTDSKTLSASLGATVPVADLEAKLTGCLNTVITLTNQTSEETTYKLSNDSSENNRRFALWHTVETVLVEALIYESRSLRWKLLARTSFATPDSKSAVNVTWADAVRAL